MDALFLDRRPGSGRRPGEDFAVFAPASCPALDNVFSLSFA